LPVHGGWRVTKGFISYAHDDHGAFEEMCTHLAPLEHVYGIDFWRDQRIAPGNYWTKKIEEAIEEASVHLLLVTPCFLASDYIIRTEVPAINAKYRSGDLVLPVILKRCMWKPFVGSLQAAPMTSSGRLQAVAEWKPQAHGYDAVREQLQKAIEDYLGAPTGPAFDWKKP
jgi:TIR domain